MALSPRGIGIPDNPLSPYKLERHEDDMRAVEPFISTLRSDDEAWASLLTDTQHLQIAKAVFGKRLLTKRQGSLL